MYKRLFSLIALIVVTSFIFGNVSQIPRYTDEIKLRMAKSKSLVTNGQAIVKVKVPSPARFIVSGSAWFTDVQDGDSIKIYVTDEDNLLGGGNGTVIDSFTDTDVATDCQGWWINPHEGCLKVEAMLGPEKIPGGFYIKVVGNRLDNSNNNDNLYVNIKWGASP